MPTFEIARIAACGNQLYSSALHWCDRRGAGAGRRIFYDVDFQRDVRPGDRFGWF